MTDRPYTDDDLRTEAARQLANLSGHLDADRVGQEMCGAEIESRPTKTDVAEGAHWEDVLDDAQFDEAERAVHALIKGAADVSEWAINLGADGLEPLPEQLSAQTDNGPWFRLHFAVRPDMSDDMRRALVEGVAVEIAKHFPTV
ncbi:hypothetical protein ACH470_03190 [Streptomyces bottropensis]|uniref:hypothetical protein n=1 Tax=Streptomyces bottropensis TaxID=42235 RepID=UPI0037BAA09E